MTVCVRPIWIYWLYCRRYRAGPHIWAETSSPIRYIGSTFRPASSLGLRLRWWHTAVAGVFLIIVFYIHPSPIILLSTTVPSYDEEIDITVDDDVLRGWGRLWCPTVTFSWRRHVSRHHLCTQGLWYVYIILLAFPNFIIVCSNSYGRAHNAWSAYLYSTCLLYTSDAADE